ncbi:MAG TPA: 4-vinyl reductase [Anaerolineales bacterium]|nr:4-vinyl reductase [Anaerolineales bacterium]
MNGIKFSARILHRFVETLADELGQETFSAVISKAGLPKEWAHAAHFSALDDSNRAQAYSRLQSALRAYYGRGARGILMRIGAKLWDHLLDDSAFGLKAQAVFIRGIPKPLRRKPALELLSRFLSSAPGNITVHTLDLDLLLVDQTSPSTLDQSSDAPICFVTFGLIRECLFWANGQVYDIEERACRALGARQCEFKITIGV